MVRRTRRNPPMTRSDTALAYARRVSPHSLDFGNTGEAIQQAVAELGNGPGSVFIDRPAVGYSNYDLSTPIVLASGQNLVADSIYGVSIRARSDFAGTAMIQSSSWTIPGVASAWHWGAVDNIRLNCAGFAPHGVAIYNMGENALLRRVFVAGAADSGFLMVGLHAPLTLEHCNASGCTNYGLKITAHPAGGAYIGNSGAVRLAGFSGDANGIAHIYEDGSHAVDLTGWKSEYNPAGWVVAGNTSTIRAQGYVNTDSDDDVFRITGSAAPKLQLQVRSSGYTNTINDTVAGVTISAAGAYSQSPLITYGGATLLGGQTLRSRCPQTRTGNGSVVIDASEGDIHEVTLAGNVAASTITGALSGQQLVLTYIQDATGGRTYAWPIAQYDGGSAPDNLATAGRRDSVTLVYDGTTWYETSRSQRA